MATNLEQFWSKSFESDEIIARMKTLARYKYVTITEQDYIEYVRAIAPNRLEEIEQQLEDKKAQAKEQRLKIKEATLAKWRRHLNL